MVDTILISDFAVPRVGFGTLYITEDRGFGAALPHAQKLLKEAVRLGIRFFDTADSYGNGAAELALRDALYPYDGLMIATKGGYRHERLGAWVSDARPDHLHQALENSLKRLGVEVIDLYQLHCADPRVPYAESIGALVDMKTDGKIRHIGISNVSIAQIELARRETDIVSVQNAFNIRHGWSTDVLEYCTDNDIAFIPWMPLGDGGISWDDPELCHIAKKHGATPAQIALAALLKVSPMVLPIPGTSSIDHLRENMAAADIDLDENDLRTFWPGRH
jgi:aryl-alcohol dehydrogenase-like predicted oxidoreductase